MATAISDPSPSLCSATSNVGAPRCEPSSARHTRDLTLPFCTNSIETPDFMSDTAPAMKATEACASSIRRSIGLRTTFARNKSSTCGRMSCCQLGVSSRQRSDVDD
jgi:hypothetical protein